jgi:hypothetical protein
MAELLQVSFDLYPMVRVSCRFLRLFRGMKEPVKLWYETPSLQCRRIWITSLLCIATRDTLAPYNPISAVLDFNFPTNIILSQEDIGVLVPLSLQYSKEPATCHQRRQPRVQCHPLFSKVPKLKEEATAVDQSQQHALFRLKGRLLRRRWNHK